MANHRATREYQHTNRRVTPITPHPRFTSCGSQLLPIDEKLEAEVPSPLDNISAISTMRLTCRRREGRWSAKRIRKSGQSRERKARAAVRCRRLVGSGVHVVSRTVKHQGSRAKTTKTRTSRGMPIGRNLAEQPPQPRGKRTGEQRKEPGKAIAPMIERGIARHFPGATVYRMRRTKRAGHRLCPDRRSRNGKQAKADRRRRRGTKLKRVRDTISWDSSDPTFAVSGAGPRALRCKQDAPSRVHSTALVELSRCAAGGGRVLVA